MNFFPLLALLVLGAEEIDIETEEMEVLDQHPRENEPDGSISPVCENLDRNFFLVSLKRGVVEYEFYHRSLVQLLGRCGKTLADLKIGEPELAVFRQKSCVMNARLNYRRNSGRDPVGEPVYFRNFEMNLRRCGLAPSEVRQVCLQYGKDTRYRSVNGSGP